MDGKVNRCESLINVVITNKPKVLRVPKRNHRLGLKWQGVRCLRCRIADRNQSTPGEQARPNPFLVLTRNVISP